MEKCNLRFKIQEKVEFIFLKNNKRVIDKLNINKEINLSNLNKTEKEYIKSEIESIKNHICIESEQNITWLDNRSGDYFWSKIININTITHNKSIEGIRLWNDSNNIQLYLNNINLKVCNTQNKFEYKNIKTEESRLVIEYENKFIETIDNRMMDWFECMKIMNNNSNKCYSIIYWKENLLKKTEFYLNNKINMYTILENSEIISQLYL